MLKRPFGVVLGPQPDANLRLWRCNLRHIACLVSVPRTFRNLPERSLLLELAEGHGTMMRTDNSVGLCWRA